jgi:hypothetical protein
MLPMEERGRQSLAVASVGTKHEQVEGWTGYANAGPYRPHQSDASS